MACRSEMPEPDRQERTAPLGQTPMQTTKTGLPGLDFRDRTVRADFAMIYP